MLWYKALRESETRFVLSALTIAGLCTVFVFFHEQAVAGIYDEPLTYIAYIWRSTYKGFLREIFVLLVLMLGVGGLLRERAYGTAGFTLALPVSRLRLTASRAAIGFAEVVVLSLLPALLIPALSPLVHQSYPWSQAFEFSILWICGGAFVFTMGFLASVIFSGEYTAPVAAFLVLVVYSAVADLPFLEHYWADIHDIMSGAGMPYFRPDTSLLTGPLPWRALAVVLVIICGLFAAASRICRDQDF